MWWGRYARQGSALINFYKQTFGNMPTAPAKRQRVPSPMESTHTVIACNA